MDQSQEYLRGVHDALEAIFVAGGTGILDALEILKLQTADIGNPSYIARLERQRAEHVQHQADFEESMAVDYELRRFI